MSKFLSFGFGNVLLDATIAAEAAAANTGATEAVEILCGKCTQCHAKGLAMSGLDLRSREAALRGGIWGNDIGAAMLDFRTKYLADGARIRVVAIAHHLARNRSDSGGGTTKESLASAMSREYEAAQQEHLGRSRKLSF